MVCTRVCMQCHSNEDELLLIFKSVPIHLFFSSDSFVATANVCDSYNPYTTARLHGAIHFYMPVLLLAIGSSRDHLFVTGNYF